MISSIRQPDIREFFSGFFQHRLALILGTVCVLGFWVLYLKLGGADFSGKVPAPTHIYSYTEEVH